MEGVLYVDEVCIGLTSHVKVTCHLMQRCKETSVTPNQALQAYKYFPQTPCLAAGVAKALRISFP